MYNLTVIRVILHAECSTINKGLVYNILYIHFTNINYITLGLILYLLLVINNYIQKYKL